MTAASLTPRIAALEASGATFALATVVAVHRPTSAKPGARGIILPDGTIEGWVGGSCAQPVVVREALRSLQDGQPRLLRLSKDGPGEGRRADGIVELVMTCHSGGTLEIYVEPRLPAPALWVAGTTPIARALAALGSAAGWRVSVIDPVADPAAFPGVDRVVTDGGLRVLDPDTSPYAVVATQGVWDEEAVQRLLLREQVAYVGLIASPTRAAVLRQWLLEEGVPRERVAALRAPAGMDIGGETPEEVAISILAEITSVRHGRAPFVAMPGPATLAGADAAAADQPEAAPDDIVLVDPVCGMTVEQDRPRHLAEHNGVVYAFCRMGCRTAFIREPERYLNADTPVVRMP
ncbi:MAG TPA: XdhC family protein [Candidatus Limnocylindrales bacterium]